MNVQGTDWKHRGMTKQLRDVLADKSVVVMKRKGWPSTTGLT